MALNLRWGRHSFETSAVHVSWKNGHKITYRIATCQSEFQKEMFNKAEISV